VSLSDALFLSFDSNIMEEAGGLTGFQVII
jgi:hypothetical protein